MNKLDMTAFIGSGFDVQQQSDDDQDLFTIHEQVSIEDLEIFDYRPRMHHKFVLDDYAKVAVDGMAWNGGY